MNLVNDVNALTAEILGFLQNVGVGIAAIFACVAGYHFLFGGAEGNQKGKKALLGVIIGLVIIFGCEAGVEYFQSKINF